MRGHELRIDSNDIHLKMRGHELRIDSNDIHLKMKGHELGLCVVSQYIGCIDTLSIRYISHHSFSLHDTSNGTFLLKFRISDKMYC